MSLLIGKRNENLKEIIEYLVENLSSKWLKKIPKHMYCTWNDSAKCRNTLNQDQL
jgi:hypothetical protein